MSNNSIAFKKPKSTDTEELLSIKNLHTSFYTQGGEVQALRGINLNIKKGEVLGIVGESGSGKSVTMASLMGLLPDSGKVKEGEFVFNGESLTNLSEAKMEAIRGNLIGMIFQDPMTSLNPVFSIGYQLTEHLIKHKKISKKEARLKAVEILGTVGIDNPAERINNYPHEFSGGQRQRIMIAIALITDPLLLIADEPTTALDVTIQAQILELMKKMRDELDTSIILITHDLGVVANMCDRISVMYGGTVVEEGTSREIFYNARHPYTWGLLKSVPNPDAPFKERLVAIEGQPPDLMFPPKGCPFAERCEHAMRICFEYTPEYYEISETHKSACWLEHPEAPKVT